MDETTVTNDGEGQSVPPPSPEPSLQQLITEAAAATAQIKTLLREAENSANAAAQAKSACESVATDVQAKLTEANGVATHAVAAKTQIESSQAIIATKSDHIEDAQKHADQVRANLDRIQTTATQAANDADGAKERAQTAADAAATKLADIQGVRTQADAELVAVVASNNEAKSAAGTTKELAKKADNVTEVLQGYETRLADLEKRCAMQLKAIESLLPGAASAGLAYSFEQQKKRFEKPQKNWLIAGLIALTGLLLVGAIGMPGLPLIGSLPQEGLDGGLLKHVLIRLPLAIPLIWIAIYAGHNYMVALRIEEDYAYKEAVSRAFEGYKREMANVPGLSPNDSGPLVTLCTNVLNAMAERPGRIYEGRQESLTPLSQAVSSLKDVTDSLIKNKNP